MSGRRDSNPRHSAWEADTLPTELRPRNGTFISLKTGNQDFFINFSLKIKIDLKNTRNRQDKIVELAFLAIIMILSFLFWDTYFVYPVKLFAVLMHEVSHGIVTLLTGGKVVSINIGFDLGGSCISEGGKTVLIASAGYLGSLLFGILVFISPNNIKIGKWVLSIIFISIFLFTLICANGALFIALDALLTCILVLAAFYMSIPIIAIFIRSFGLVSCVYVLFDIKEDLLESKMTLTDTIHLSTLTGIPPIVFGLGWLFLSILILIIAFRISYKRRD